MVKLKFEDLKLTKASDVKERFIGNELIRIGLKFFDDGGKRNTWEYIKDCILLRFEDYILRALSDNLESRYDKLDFFVQANPYATSKEGMTHVWSDSEDILQQERYIPMLANNKVTSVTHDNKIVIETPWRKGAVTYTKECPFEFVYEDISDEDIYDLCETNKGVTINRESPFAFYSYKDNETLYYGGFVRGFIMINHENVFKEDGRLF